jgi:hypothetical protein
MKANEALKCVWRDTDWGCEAILPNPDPNPYLRARVWANDVGDNSSYVFSLFDGNQSVDRLYDNYLDCWLEMDELSHDGWGTECMSDGGHNVVVTYGEEESTGGR